MAIVKDLGMVTAYAYAVAGGYEGTEAEFTEMLGQAGITLEQLENLTAVATTLSEGSEATASYSEGVLTFGIPRGNTGATGPQGPQGVQGETGNGIASIAKTGTSGLVDTYTITFTDGTTTTFTVTNGADGDITNVAAAFDATKAYSVGDMVLYQGALYAFTAAHPAGAWVGSDAQAVILADEVTELKDDLTNDIENIAVSGKTLSATDLQQGEWVNGAIFSATSRLCTKKLYPVIAGMIVNYNTSANLNIAIRVFDKNGVQTEVTSWLGGTDTNETYTIRGSGRMGIVFKRTSGSYVTPANYTSWGAVTNIQNSLDGVTAAISGADSSYIGAPRIGKTEAVIKPVFDHLFVNSGQNAVIPHESVYHVRVSKRLGFNMIEANIARTSDGVFIVNHLNNGAFGTYFHHVDGTTDISSILVSSVTWQWIVDNVRYNSTIPKYRTRPCRIEEFLGECKQQGLFPLIMVQSEEVRDIVEQYMGVDNYFAYDGTRKLCPHAVISQWQRLTTKDAILKYCRGFGAPMLYSMENTNDFTNEQLKDIITALHKEGFWIGTAYNDGAWYRLSNLGFDIIGTTRMMNRIERGNKYNIDSMFGFSGYTFTNATENDGVLTYTADGTFKPNVDNDLLTVGGADLQIVFDGEITIPAFGELNSITYTRDASIPVFVTTPLIHKSPQVVLQVKSGTVIYDCTYRVIEC